MRAKEFVAEAFDSNVPMEIIIQNPLIFRTAGTINDRVVIFQAQQVEEPGWPKSSWEILFFEPVSKRKSLAQKIVPKSGPSYSADFTATGRGGQMMVFSFVLQSIRQFVELYRPDWITFESKKEGNRADLYSKMISRVQLPGYELDATDEAKDRRHFLIKRIGAEDPRQLDELKFLGSECTKDCSGHRAGYAWSKRKGGVLGNSPYSPSFNKGAALAKAGK